ncbi:MAG TPA: glycosyltransferase family 2 protein [Candidatus Sumerlaeota bacterium]|nr:glycosyltransferase family 2 protein [Candidatus Sumerlaeota bacterium]HMZ51404.1 glycosyltransferase family 2 protein [Candidatus Sumerlaeota bacterium]
MTTNTPTPLERPERPFLSVVIPCYNEEESLPHLYARLTKVLQKATDRYEIVFSNDGSRDQTLMVIRDLVSKDPHVRGVDLSRNFGHQVCLTAGLDAARGEAIVMMDADLQDPPELIPRLVAKWRLGADVVYAVRKKRHGEGAFKRATAAIFYRVLRYFTRISIPVDTGDFRLIDRRALDAVLAIRESNRFLRGLFTWVGFRQEPVYYVRQRRHAGETKYPLTKMMRFAMDGITSFSSVPLRFAMWVGLASSALAFLYGLRVIYTGLFGGGVPGWASTTVSVLFFGGVQLFTIGLLGEYIGRIFDEVKRRPLYLVREVIENKSVAAQRAESKIIPAYDAQKGTS